MITGRSPSFRLSTDEWAVFIAVLVFYAAMRLWGITDFPINLFL